MARKINFVYYFYKIHWPLTCWFHELHASKKFEEAKYWAEIAAKEMPSNSYILHTKGQVYAKWFNAKCKAIEKVTKTAENTTQLKRNSFRSKTITDQFNHV